MLRMLSLAVVLATLALCGCEAQDDSPTTGFSVASGLAIPSPDDLKTRIDSALRQPEGSIAYVRESNVWTPTRLPAVTKRAVATVRSYNTGESAAFVEVVVPEHNKWVLQVWRFQGGKWTEDLGLPKT